MPPTVALPIVTQELAAEDLSSADSIDLGDLGGLSLHDVSPPLDSDNLVAEDDLDDNEDISRDDELIQKASALICWQLPVSLSSAPPRVPGGEAN